MEKITSLTSEDPVKSNIEKLKQLFPTAVSEGKLILEELQALMGDYIETEKEYYSMNWAGKTEARKEANKVSTGTLRPVPDESKDWDNTGNIFIEGDNLEVLKLMQKSYSGKIKMIAIDPPYNTGKDFVYKDNYKDNLKNYLQLTGQTDEEGKKLSTNTESDGRYHSNWLNMMYPRLRLARNLLTDDGVIFINIDDNEQANLKKLCDEVFGEENMAGIFVWQARQSIQNDTDLSNSHEYVISYAKNRRQENRRLKESNFDVWFKEKSFAFLPKPLTMDKFSNPDNDVRGPWKADPFDAPNIRPNLTYEIINPNTHKVYMPPKGRCWRTTENEYKRLLEEKRIVFGKTGESKPQLKVFYNEKKHLGATINSWLDGQEFGTATKGTKLVQKLFDGQSPFDTVKPIELLINLIKFSFNSDDIILDFFAGSGTTAHAVMALNAEDGGKRKCISVQLPEPIEEKSEAYKAGYNTIAEITKERIRRAGKAIKEETQTEIKKLQEKLEKSIGLALIIEDAEVKQFTFPEGVIIDDAAETLLEEINQKQAALQQLDVGFRVYKLDSSNIIAWDTDKESFEKQIEIFSETNADHIKVGRNEKDVLYEILLKYGLELTVPIEERVLAGATVYNIGYGSMYVCLANGIESGVARALGEWHRDISEDSPTVIFKDSGFDTDADKTNTIQTLLQFGIEKVESI